MLSDWNALLSLSLQCRMLRSNVSHCPASERVRLMLTNRAIISHSSDYLHFRSTDSERDWSQVSPGKLTLSLRIREWILNLFCLSSIKSLSIYVILMNGKHKDKMNEKNVNKWFKLNLMNPELISGMAEGQWGPYLADVFIFNYIRSSDRLRLMQVWTCCRSLVTMVRYAQQWYTISLSLSDERI